jgi:hypothetical protein
MSHLPPVTWFLAASFLASLAGAGVAIHAGFRAGRRGSPTPPVNPAAAFVAAALFAAMAGAMIYQGVSNGFPPSFLGAAIFLAGSVIALFWGLRRPQA